MYYVHIYNQIGQAIQKHDIISLLVLRRSFLQLHQEQYISSKLGHPPTSAVCLELQRLRLLEMYIMEEKVAVLWTHQLQQTPLHLGETLEERQTTQSLLQSHQTFCAAMVQNLSKGVAVHSEFPFGLLPPNYTEPFK